MTEREPTGRRKRIPLGTPQQKMARPENKGYFRRWVNDTAGRVQRASQEDSYRHVRVEGSEDGRKEREPERMVVGTNEDGTPRVAYLMEKPMSHYKEDQAEKQAPLDEFDKVLRRGNIVGADERDKDGFYVPSEGISVRTGTEKL